MLSPRHYYHIRPDELTGEQLVIAGNLNDNYVTGEQLVRTTEDIPGHSGLPQMFLDAAANADDTYFLMGTADRDCTHAMLSVDTKDAIVSFDGGATDHVFVRQYATTNDPQPLIVMPGLHIPKGAKIAGKNAVAANDYVSLRVVIW